MPTVAYHIARSLLSLDCSLFTHVPGFGGTEVFAALGELLSPPPVGSFHEEVAVGLAHGAALKGRRTAVLMKTHGYLKAANAISDALFCGTSAGLVLVLFEDLDGSHSDSIFHIEPLLEAMQIPYLRLERHSVVSTLRAVFARSEQLSLPCVVVVDSALVHEPALADEAAPEPSPEPLPAPPSYQRDLQQHLVGPLFSGYQRQVLDAKLAGREWSAVPRPTLPSIEQVPPGMRPTVAMYRGFYEVFREFRGDTVIGDTSVASMFALPPFGCIDAVSYMGGSVPLALGALLAGHENVWAVSGDFSFLAAGHIALSEALSRGLPLRVALFRNGRAQATGGQPLPSAPLDAVLHGYERYVRSIADPQDKAEVTAALSEATAAAELRVVVLEFRG